MLKLDVLNRNARSLCIFLLVFGFSVVSHAQAQAQAINCPQPQASLLWQVAGKNSRVTLFGSLHVGEAGFYPLPKEVEQAFRRADYLVFEIDPAAMEDPAVLAQIMQNGMLAPNENLADYLSTPVLNDLKQRLQQLGLPSDALLRYRPWFLTMLLTSQQVISLGYVPEFGIERYLSREKPADATLLALESVADQLALLQGLDGENYLAYTLKTFDSSKEKMRRLVAAWRCANKAELEELLVKEFESDQFPAVDLAQLKKKLLDDRNLTMADSIGEFLSSGRGEYFVVVGAAHYLGEGSIIELLEERGHPVKAIGNQ